MQKKFLFVTIALFLVAFTHKFYVSINQVSWNEPKKRLEITSRFFVDDINQVLETIHQRPFYVGDKLETPQDIELLKVYFEKNLTILVDQKKVAFALHHYEMEDDVLICYFLVKNISKLKSISIKNTILMDLESDQQNIHHLTIHQKKHTRLLTKQNSSFEIKI